MPASEIGPEVEKYVFYVIDIYLFQCYHISVLITASLDYKNSSIIVINDGNSWLP